MESIVRIRFSYRILLAFSLLWIAACSSGDAPPASPWGTPSVIQGGQTNARDARLAMTATGSGPAVWRQDNGSGDYTIVSAGYSAGTGRWSAPQVIQLGTGDADAPQVAVDGNGNAVAVWLQFYRFGRFQVWANRYTAALGAWGIPQVIQEGEADSLAPQVALDAGGNAFVVWCQDNGSYAYTVRANRYDAGTGVWRAPQVIQTGADDAAYPQVAADAGGNAFAVWIQDSGSGDYNLWATRYSAGAGAGTWAAPRVIQSGAADAAGPGLAVDAAGNAISVWYQDNGTGDYTIRANRYAVNASQWGAPQVIQKGNDDAGFPQVRLNANGNAIAVWSQLDSSGVSQVWANRFPAGKAAWEGPELIQSGTTDALFPQVSLDGNGRAVAVWLQDDGAGTFTASAAGSR